MQHPHWMRKEQAVMILNLGKQQGAMIVTTASAIPGTFSIVYGTGDRYESQFNAEPTEPGIVSVEKTADWQKSYPEDLEHIKP